MPTTDITVEFAGQKCATIATATATEITCNLTYAAKAGDHKVVLRDANGIIPQSGDVSTINVPLVVSSTSPTSLNPVGGDILTITGTGFPTNTAEVVVTFADGSGCTVQTTTPTQITC